MRQSRPPPAREPALLAPRVQGPGPEAKSRHRPQHSPTRLTDAAIAGCWIPFPFVSKQNPARWGGHRDGSRSIGAAVARERGLEGPHWGRGFGAEPGVGAAPVSRQQPPIWGPGHWGPKLRLP